MPIRKRILLLVLTSILLPGYLAARDKMEIRTEINWEDSFLLLNMTAPIAEEPNQPTGRFKTEQSIIRQTPTMTGEVLLPLIVDSRHTVGDLVLQDPDLLRRLENLSEKMTKIFTTATPDREFLTVRYSLPLFPDLAGLLISHDKPYTLPRNPQYTPNEEFTGIVIYAGEELPYHGSNSEKTLPVPCLFPRLYSPEMNLIHSAELTDPDALRLWGNAGYTYSFDINRISGRVGVYPLRAMARAVYGKNRTDLILPEETVRKITSSEHNMELLRQGRVVIILPPRAEQPDS